MPFVFLRIPASQAFSKQQLGTSGAAGAFSADQPLLQRSDQKVVAELP